jgi:hypothetical protein
MKAVLLKGDMRYSLRASGTLEQCQEGTQG